MEPDSELSRSSPKSTTGSRTLADRILECRGRFDAAPHVPQMLASMELTPTRAEPGSRIKAQGRCAWHYTRFRRRWRLRTPPDRQLPGTSTYPRRYPQPAACEGRRCCSRCGSGSRGSDRRQRYTRRSDAGLEPDPRPQQGGPPGVTRDGVAAKVAGKPARRRSGRGRCGSRHEDRRGRQECSEATVQRIPAAQGEHEARPVR